MLTFPTTLFLIIENFLADTVEASTSWDIVVQERSVEGVSTSSIVSSPTSCRTFHPGVIFFAKFVRP